MIACFSKKDPWTRDSHGRALHWVAKEMPDLTTVRCAFTTWAVDRDHAVTSLAVHLFSDDEDEPVDRDDARRAFDAGGFSVAWLN